MNKIATKRQKNNQIERLNDHKDAKMTTKTQK